MKNQINAETWSENRKSGFPLKPTGNSIDGKSLPKEAVEVEDPRNEQSRMLIKQASRGGCHGFVSAVWLVGEQ